MKDKDIVAINNTHYRYNEFYDRLEVLKKHKTTKEIACSKCKNREFSISYGDYECIANCNCGHSFTIYDG